MKMAAGRLPRGLVGFTPLYRRCFTPLTGNISILSKIFVPAQALCASQVVRLPFADTGTLNPASVAPTREEGATLSPSVVTEEPVRHDRYIPITRRHLVRSLMEEANLLTGTERDNFARFAAALDAHLYQKYYEYMDKMKALYDHLDPDKDTIARKKLTRQQQLDDEYWLLHLISGITDKANYTPISQTQLMSALTEHDTVEGVNVSVDPQLFEVLRIWTRGKKALGTSMRERIKRVVTLKGASEQHMYTRVMVALRKKGSAQVQLKMFKEVPCSQLQHLIPGAKIQMTRRDQMLIFSAAAVVTISGAAKLIATASTANLPFSVAIMSLFAFFGFNTWLRYSTKRNHYLANLSQFLFYKAVSHNRGVLTLLSDRAQDEEFKEMLLSYTFLLAAPNRRGIPGTTHDEGPPKYYTEDSLKAAVEKWISSRFGVMVHFDHRDALDSLQSAGLLQPYHNGTLRVTDIEEALNILPNPMLSWSGMAAVRDSQALEYEAIEEKTV